MKPTRILMAVSLASLVACTDNPNAVLTGPIDPQQPILPAPSTVTIAGRISVKGAAPDRLIELTDANGNVYRLVGNQAGVIASVSGGDVVARGTLDANPGFVVQEFQVTSMHGRPALDGVLELTTEGFALRLSDGSVRVVTGLTSECIEYLGARLWVTGWDESSEVAFGLIAAS